MRSSGARHARPRDNNGQSELCVSFENSPNLSEKRLHNFVGETPSRGHRFIMMPLFPVAAAAPELGPSLPPSASVARTAYHIRNNVSGIFNAFHPKVDMSQRNIPFCPLSPFLCDDILRRRIYEVNFRIRKQRIPPTPFSVKTGYSDSLLSRKGLFVC